MTQTAQEPKYDFQNGRVINRAAGEEIPLDEPVFVFRARDVHAREVLSFYANLVCGIERDSDHHQAVKLRLADFQRFAAEHPERMKTPDTDLSAFRKADQ